MQADLPSDEDMSFMTFSEPQLFTFIIAINHMKNTRQWLFLQFKPKETELHPQYQNGFFVQALCPISPSRQQSSLPGQQAFKPSIH